MASKRRTEAALAVAGCLLPAYLLLRTLWSEFSGGWFAILLWMCSPWIAVYFIGFMTRTFPPAIRVAWLTAAATALALAHAYYFDILFVRHPSTGGLAFITVPLAAFGFLGVVLLILVLIKTLREHHAS